MKIALCFSGQPRQVILGSEYIKNNLLDYDKMDIFVHCWWSEDMIGNNFATRLGMKTNDSVPEDVLQIIEDVYTPMKMIYDPPIKKDFSTLDYELRKKKWIRTEILDYKISDDDKIFPNIIYNNTSMWESIKRCNQLKIEYEKQNNFTYDIVIKCRFDLGFESGFKFSPIKDNVFYCKSFSWDRSIHWSSYAFEKKIVGNFGMNDIFYFGSSKVIDSISLFGDNIDSLLKSTDHGYETHLMFDEYIRSLGYLHNGLLPIKYTLLR